MAIVEDTAKNRQLFRVVAQTNSAARYPDDKRWHPVRVDLDRRLRINVVFLEMVCACFPSGKC